MSGAKAEHSDLSVGCLASFRYQGATATFVLPLMPVASIILPDMVWLPGVFRMKPFVQV
jgi:hypothetical protein